MNTTERTVTIGQMLCNLSAAEDSSDKEEALEKLEEVISDHFDEQFIRVCMDSAKRGEFSANIGKCLPPDLYDEGISYENGECGTIIAKW